MFRSSKRKLNAASKDTKHQGNGTKNFITSLSEYRSIRDAVRDKHFPLQVFHDFITEVCQYAKDNNLIPELRDQTKSKPTKMSVDHTCVKKKFKCSCKGYQTSRK